MPSHLLANRFVTGVEISASRSGQSPPDIQFVEWFVIRESHWQNLIKSRTEFANPSPQAKSLGLNLDQMEDSCPLPSILENFFVSCTPGTLA